MAESVAQFLSRELPNALSWAGRFRLSAATVVCFAIFWSIASVLGIPTVVGHGGSLMNHPSPMVAMGAVATMLIVCTLVGKFIVGALPVGTMVQHDGGLVAALLGMVAVAFRLGSVRYAMFAMPQASVMLLLAVELILIYVIIAFCWLALQFLAPTAQAADPVESLGDKFKATGVHVVVMTACMIFLAASDATAQGYAAVGLSAALASMAAHLASPVRSSFWFWVSPALVGLLGYTMVYFNPSGLAIGYPDGLLSSLARATPIAYASAGPAGAIFGFWIALGWQQEEHEAEPEVKPESAAKV